jgi:hypothetical protein
MPGERRRYGRNEQGLNRDLATRHDIPAAERAALREQAYALDLAAANRDSDAISKANAVYLELREAAGLSAGGAKPVDAIDALLAGILDAGAGGSDPANT